jgi:hypothetical protein
MTQPGMARGAALRRLREVEIYDLSALKPEV